MRGFATLVKKEMRDHALSTAVCAAAAVGVSWPVQKWIYKFVEPEWTSSGLVPALLGLFLVLLASDLFAADVATRRMDAFVVLPVSPAKHWVARVAFLALAGAALAAWTLGVNAALLAAGGKAGVAAEMWGHVGGAGAEFAWAALFGAGTLFVSATGVGGFRAALLGVLAAWAAVGAAYVLQTTDGLRSIRYGTADETLAPALLACATLVVASYAAFVRGRAFLGRSRRAFAWGAAPLSLLIVPGAAIAGARMRELVTLEPGSPLVEVQQIQASPDGRFLAMSVFNTNQDCNDTSRAWVVRVEDGALFSWSARGDNLGGWTREGLLGLWRRDFRWGADEEGSITLREPTDGRVVRVSSVEEWTSGTLILDGWSRHARTWMRWDAYPAKSIGEWRLRRGSPAATFAPIYSRGMPVPCEEPNVVLRVTEKGALVRTNLQTRADLPLVASGIEATGGLWSLSPDGRYLLVHEEEGMAVLETVEYTRVAGPWKNRGAWWSMGPGAGACIGLSGEDAEHADAVLDVATGRETRLPAGVANSSQAVAPLPDGRVAVLVNGREVLLLDADGKFVRKLYGAER